MTVEFVALASFIVLYVLTQYLPAWARGAFVLAVLITFAVFYEPLRALPKPFGIMTASTLGTAVIAVPGGAAARALGKGYPRLNRSYWAGSALIDLPICFLALSMGGMATDGLQ